MECSRKLHDPLERDSPDDCSAHCPVQEEMLQDHPWLADTLISYAAVPVLLSVY